MIKKLFLFLLLFLVACTSLETPIPKPDPIQLWHEPGSHDGLNAHEHGDAPPDWVQEFISENHDRLGINELIYGGDESTPNENLYKHQGFKGYSTHFNETDQYFRVHMMTTPLGQTGVFHSLEVYERDTSGNVSFVQGWIDYAEGKALESENSKVFYQAACGDPNPMFDGPQPAGRPRMVLNTVYCWEQENKYIAESWYSDFHPTLPEMGMNSDDTYFGSPGDSTDPSTWIPSPYKHLGLSRRVEATWNLDALPRGWFVADQFGRILDGMDDESCGEPVVAQGLDVNTICLWQYLAPTAQNLGSPGNAVEYKFPGQDIVELPN